MRRKLNNWGSELNHSIPKSFLVDIPRSRLPKPNPTPFNPKKEFNQ
jgi:hypothetical protein